MSGTPGGVARLNRARRLPLLGNVAIRTAIGFLVVLLSTAAAWNAAGHGRFEVLVALAATAWLPGMWLADKYVHKYPQRYFTYLVASHLKAATISAAVLTLIIPVVDDAVAAPDVLWAALGLTVVADGLISLLHRTEPAGVASACGQVSASDGVPREVSEPAPIDTAGILAGLPSSLGYDLAAFLREHLPPASRGSRGVLVVEQESLAGLPREPREAGLLVCGPLLNDIRRLNRFLLGCGSRMPVGGYLVGRYVSHDTLTAELKVRYPGPLSTAARLFHFVWRRALPKVPGLNRLYFALTKGRNRVFSRVEIWGRLAYCGMSVVAETSSRRETLLLARREGPPVSNRRPSYYPVVALEKVGLGGAILRTHKLRSMFPYSEFLQKRIFEEHGLAATGKFANDYRLTEYGAFIRKYWIDELPQVFDWIRGDVKLVGMRATSPHYLALYPQELYDLYIQTKPGLIPPIFDESTPGLDGIIAVELTYLRRYWRNPFLTDVRYLFQTLTDIFLRGVRSK